MKRTSKGEENPLLMEFIVFYDSQGFKSFICLRIIKKEKVGNLWQDIY